MAISAHCKMKILKNTRGLFNLLKTEHLCCLIYEAKSPRERSVTHFKPMDVCQNKNKLHHLRAIYLLPFAKPRRARKTLMQGFGLPTETAIIQISPYHDVLLPKPPKLHIEENVPSAVSRE